MFWPVRRRSLGVRRYALLVRRARWTNAEHSSSFVVCVGIFVHAQNCARSSTHECTRQKDASHAQSALDQRRTESESESESFYSVLLQTQETSAKTYLVAVAEATWKKIYT